MTALTFGPFLSYASMRLRYRPTSFSDESAFASIAALMSAIVAVDRSKLAASAAAGRSNSSETISMRARVMETTFEAVSDMMTACSLALAAGEQRELLLEFLVADDPGHSFAVLEYQRWRSGHAVFLAEHQVP